MPVEGSRLDAAAEQAGRWTAARSTRRSFIARVGRVAVLVAGGPAIATLLFDADPASARVCGQSGVGPKCDTFDCSDTWGWCWYANGCCEGGRLKKICDCCTAVSDEVRGYCPAGLKLKCLVESCNADPRLQTRALHHLTHGDPVAIAIDIARVRYPATVPIAVLGDATTTQWMAVAASVGRVVAGPVLYTRFGRVHQAVLDELERLRVEFVKVVGPNLREETDEALASRGIAVEHIGTSTDTSTFAAEVATWSRTMTGARAALVVMPGLAERLVASAGALAHARRWPLLLGDTDATASALATPRPATTVYVISEDPGDAGRFPGGVSVSAPSVNEFAVAIADLAIDAGVPISTVSLAPREHDVIAAGAAAMPAPLLLFSEGSLSGPGGWLLARRGAIETVYVHAENGMFPSQARYDLQSAVNEFDAHLLRGEAGDGLPVIPQPLAERPIGKARR